MLLTGRPGEVTATSAPTGGWHWTEWTCELVGTALLLLGGLSAICLDFGPGSPVTKVIADHSARLLVTGLLFSGSGALVTISPLGRRSGAHLNPAVTLGFWGRGRVHRSDLVGYVVAQSVGALLGTALALALWRSTARAVKLGVTQPGHGIGTLGAAGVEAVMTAALVGTILLMTSSRSTARWTPLAVWLVVAALVWQGAPWTGTSLNPARSLAPALILPDLHSLGAYLIGPLLGSLTAVALVAVLPGVEPMTAKLFHDVRYQSTFGSLFAVPERGPSINRREGPVPPARPTTPDGHGA
jgi:aquaporin Z